MYLEIDEGFPDHPKTLRFCRLIGDPNGSAYLIRLWAWATRSAPDGELGTLEPEDIELPLRWRGEPGACFAALVAAGFIDVDGAWPGGKRLHNWGDRMGGAIERMNERVEEKRKAAAERKQRQRDREKAERDGHADVTRDSSVTVTPCHAPRQDKTSPDQTRQDQPAQSDPRAIPGTTAPEPGPVTLARQVAAVVEEAGEMAARAPLALVPPPTSSKDWDSYGLRFRFAVIRSENDMRASAAVIPGGACADKASRFCGEIAGNAEAQALVEPALQRFCKQAAAEPETSKLRRDPGWAFCCFLQRFPALCEELTRKAKPARASPVRPESEPMSFAQIREQWPDPTGGRIKLGEAGP